MCLDQLKEVRKDDTLYLVSAKYAENWPHPVSAYEEWFIKDLGDVASFVDTTEAELRADLCSDDGAERASAYRSIYDYHGWANGDSEPLILTRAEARKRYRNELRRKRTA